MVGAASIQRSFIASRHHVNAQAQQVRLIDYINLDLRRALSVTTAAGRLVVKIPDFYDTSGEPRDPQIVRGLAVYGSQHKTIEYFREGAAIYRKEGNEKKELATDVSDFQLSFQDLGQSIRVSVTFIPRFQLNGSKEGNREATATHCTTLLRNKRQKTS